ncbi:MAG: twin-arginine translocase subunit TatC [Bacteroidales bacterium]|nr:twin-arginine translocase subunit TatC [Candidatus Physcocola equi]
MSETGMTFWDHLDELRGVLIRIVLMLIVACVMAFCFKEVLFGVVFAPKEPDFLTWRVLAYLSGKVTGSPVVIELSKVQIINTGLAQQFAMHMKVALWAGLFLVSPYVIYQLFGFISPALYDNERKGARVATVGAYVMFVLGVLVSYFLVFPLTYRFLVDYQVSEEVVNMISLESYIDTLMLLCILMGVMFEIPVVAWLLGKMGLLSGGLMRKYRRHAIVAIVSVSAVITPTTDIFTLLLVSVPIWLLYEVSVFLVKK